MQKRQAFRSPVFIGRLCLGCHSCRSALGCRFRTAEAVRFSQVYRGVGRPLQPRRPVRVLAENSERSDGYRKRSGLHRVPRDHMARPFSRATRSREASRISRVPNSIKHIPIREATARGRAAVGTPQHPRFRCSSGTPWSVQSAGVRCRASVGSNVS